jgi:hypothetical protein
MENKYTKLTKSSLKGEILIHTRKTYIALIAEDILVNKIIPIEYIDKQLYLINFNKGISNGIIDDTQRLKYINDLLLKECIKGTSKMISNMCL